jgi:DNA-binding winged helix-turn-helix (wHTH) protein
LRFLVEIMDQPTTHLYKFDRFCLEVVKRLLWRDGKIVPLKGKDFDLLLALVERSGQVLGKDELMKRVWPDQFVEEGNLSVRIFALRRALGDTLAQHSYIVTIPGRGYSFVAAVRAEPNESATVATTSPPSSSTIIPSAPTQGMESLGGAVPLDSPFYIERPVDREFHAAVARGEGIVLVKGARQVGKTSLLARALQRAREAGARVILTDFLLLNAAHLASSEALLLTLAKSIANQLELPVAPHQVWDAELGPSMNFTHYMRSQVLQRYPTPLVWGLDEVDRLFTCPFGGEIFGLFRSWHNARSLDPQGQWSRLTLAMAYATEAHLFINDAHLSPFNVGTRLVLDDFTLEQVAELNRRYDSLLSEAEVERFFGLVCGHPYLVRRGLHELATRGITLDELEAEADRDDGPFGDHLRRLLVSLNQDAALCEVVRGLIAGRSCPTAESFYRLRGAGVVVGDAAQEARLRCRLYANYLTRRLS